MAASVETVAGATSSEGSLSPDLARHIRRVEPYDLGILGAVLMLLGIGTVMVYAARINEDTISLVDPTYHLRIHLAHVAAGIVVLLFGMLAPYRIWRRLTYPALLLVVLLLGLVMLFGVEAGNARRWLRLPGFFVQPAEMAKLAFILFLAYSLAKKGEAVRRFSVAFVPHLLVCTVLIMFCLFQPDFGTCVILVLLMFGMLFVAGTRLSYISLLSFVGGFLVFQAVAMNDMRLGRVLAFINPWAHRAERGYQMVNSLIAIGSGGVTGQGLGFGGQTLTGFLPEGHTDFILSVTAEQLGLVGVIAVLAMFGYLLFRGVATALAARDDYGRFLAFGITLLLGLQAVINMLVAVALVPTKGLTLPFVSHGGSSMLVCCLAIGILLNISRDVRVAPVRELTGASAESERKGPRTQRKRRGRLFGKRTVPKQKPLEEVVG